LDYGIAEQARPEKLVAILEADKAHTIKAVLAVQAETLSSVRNDVAALGRWIPLLLHH